MAVDFEYSFEDFLSLRGKLEVIPGEELGEESVFVPHCGLSSLIETQSQ
jgi:hypothetical protein